MTHEQVKSAMLEQNIENAIERTDYREVVRLVSDATDKGVLKNGKVPRPLSELLDTLGITRYWDFVEAVERIPEPETPNEKTIASVFIDTR